jgi:zinc protease
MTLPTVLAALALAAPAGPRASGPAAVAAPVAGAPAAARPRPARPSAPGAAAAPAEARLEIPDIPFKKWRLPNGLRLVVHEDRKAPIVAVNVWYHVGSKNERPGKTGFAHLFEHLMFNGSQHFDDDWFKAVQKLGATDLNGTTSRDRTNYFQNVPVPALDTVLWLESDRMGHLLPAVTQARLDEQRGVVKNERRQTYENQPYGRAFELVAAATYPRAHPYSWIPIGSMEDLDAASLDDVKEWFRTWYGAGNALLVVAGDVDAEEVKRKVELYFGDIPSGPPLARHESWVARRTGEQRQALYDRVPQARAYLVWNTPEWGTRDAALLDVAAQVLSSGKSSRLYKRLVYDAQIATDVSAFAWTQEIAGQFFVMATARPGGDLVPVEKAAREELDRLLRDCPTAAETRRARTEILAAFTRGVERIGGFGGKSDVLAQGEIYGGRPDAYQERLRTIRDATPAQVCEATRRWLSDGLYVLSVLPWPEGAVAAQGADRSRMPEAGPSPEARFPAFERSRLSNGLEVVVASHPAVPVVSFQLVVDAGYAADPPGGAGTAKLAAGLLPEGTRRRGAVEISDALRELGATLSTRSSLDSTTVAFSALRARLDPSLELLAEVLLDPAFPEAEFDRQRKLQLAAIDRESSEPSAMANRVLPRLVYGDGHAYANPLTGSGTRASVSALRREDAERWYRTWFRPGNAVLVVVGDTTPAEILPRLERLLGPWKGGEVPRKSLAAVELPPGERVFVVDRPGAAQSVILAGEAAPPRANPDEIAQGVANWILGGQFTSRINMNLREDKHWSYGARSALLDARGPRLFFVSAPVQSDKTREAIEEIRKELRGIRGDRPASAAEVADARSALTLALPGRWETGGAVASSIAEVVTFGLGDRYWDAYAAKVKGLTPDDVARAARFLDPERMTWVVVGDRARIEPELRKLGLGDPVLLDPDGNPVAASPPAAPASSPAAAAAAR